MQRYKSLVYKSYYHHVERSTTKKNWNCRCNGWLKHWTLWWNLAQVHGHVVNSNTYTATSIPAGIWNTKSRKFNTFKARWSNNNKKWNCRCYNWLKQWTLQWNLSQVQGHLVNSNTLNRMSIPVGICNTKSRTLTAFKAMWRFLALSLPFCIAGTRAAAAAHSTVIPVHNQQD